MGFLQQVRAGWRVRRQFSALTRRLARGDASITDLKREVDLAEATLGDRPDHFGLTFVLGQACSAVAGREIWDNREPWLERAVGFFERALTLAASGRLDGAEGVAEIGAWVGAPGLGLGDRARLAAAFQAGVLRAGEFRVRDPARAIAHLRQIVDRVSGYHPAWYYLGEAYLLAGQFDDAERAWRAGLAHSPDDSLLRQVLRNLPADRVRHRAKSGHWPGVLEALQRLPDGAMPESDRLTLEGDAYRALGDDRKARESWQAALEADRHAAAVRSRLRKLDRDLTSAARRGCASRPPCW